MKICALALVPVSALLLLSGCNKPTAGPIGPASNTPGATATATPDEIAMARANFAKHCSVCHGDDGTGGTKTVEGKKLRVPSLKEGHATTHSDEKLAKQITNGDDEMPAFKDKLSAKEIDDLVRIIRKDFQGK